MVLPSLGQHLRLWSTVIAGAVALGCGPSVGSGSGSADGDGTSASGNETTTSASVDTNESTGSIPVTDVITHLAVEGRQGVCVVLDSNRLRCWGELLPTGIQDSSGRDEVASTATELALPDNVVSIDGDVSHACLATQTGDVYCWGSSEYGELGYGTTETIGDDESILDVEPVPLPFLALQVAVGLRHTCAITMSGQVSCWGYAWGGTLGNLSDEPIGDDELVPDVYVEVGGPARSVCVGIWHSCVLREDNAVLCWGKELDDQLYLGYPFLPGVAAVGDDETPASLGPVELGDDSIAELSCTGTGACVVYVDGTLRCWGAGFEGGRLLGMGLGTDERVNIGDDEHPIDGPLVQLSGPAVSIAYGGDPCVVLEGGGVQCWGLGTVGAHGYGHTDYLGDDEVPADAGLVEIDGEAVLVETEQSVSCTVTAENDLYCWGWGYLGYEGIVDPVGDDETPASVGPVPL